MVTFDSSARRMFGLNDFLTQKSLAGAISNVTFTAGGTHYTLFYDHKTTLGTNISSGMNAAINVFFNPDGTPANGNRLGVPDIMVVITDGQDSSDVRTAHDKAENLGIVIFAVGVGSGKGKQGCGSLNAKRKRRFLDLKMLPFWT